MVRCFTIGKTIEDLAKDFKCTKLTISRNIKRCLGEKKYKEIIEQNKLPINHNQEKNEKIYIENNNVSNSNISNENFEEEFFSVNSFIEITPLNQEIDNLTQKDLSSVPIAEIEFPKIVYIIVDKKIELETKYLKDYPDWQFLSQDELNRKTIEIFVDLKNAKRICNKEQKVIKVPNTQVFKIVAPLLRSRGISRIVSSEKLIAL